MAKSQLTILATFGQGHNYETVNGSNPICTKWEYKQLILYSTTCRATSSSSKFNTSFFKAQVCFAIFAM